MGYNDSLQLMFFLFEFKVLELALELASTSLDAQVTELEIEIYPLLDELVSSINTINLEHVRRLKSHLLGLTQSRKFFKLGPTPLLSDFMLVGKHFCGEDSLTLKEKYQTLEAEDFSRYCFSSAYIVALLHDSLGIALDDNRLMGKFLRMLLKWVSSWLNHLIVEYKTRTFHIIGSVMAVKMDSCF